MRALLAALLLCSCIRPAEERALLDLEIGRGEAEGIEVIADGAHIRELGPETLSMWVQAPSFTLRGSVQTARTLSVTLRNAMPDGIFTGDSNAILDQQLSATSVRWLIDVDGPFDLRFAPVDAEEPNNFRFAVMSDIQTGLDTVGDVFSAVNAHPDVRFVVSTGDLVQDGSEREYDELETAFGLLDVPFYSTLGNHDIAKENPGPWHERFGRHNLHFEFKGVRYSLVDAANGTIDPLVYTWLEDWLANSRERVHVYAQHYPAIDPDGIRNTGMNSRSEAAKLLSMLADGNVDVTFYGHIHTYRAFENAGIPAYVSGGGGARPEKLDGIGRHFLSVDVEPNEGIRQVGIVRVD